ncbi:MAG: single-stranded DNA-binding protein [Clostridia bacterium]
MNKVVLIGNLTRDPESNTTTSGIRVCKFTVAVNRNYSSSDGSRPTDFLPVVTWRNQAENCAKFLRKGSKVGVFGSVQTRTYDAPDGTKRTFTEIVAEEVQFLSTRQDAFADDLPDLPEVQERKAKIEELKPLEDGDLPF